MRALSNQLDSLPNDPNDPNGWNELGNKYFKGIDGKAPNFCKACHCYEQALILNPKYFAANFNLGAIYQTGGGDVAKDSVKAAAYFKEAIKSDEDLVRSRAKFVETKYSEFTTAQQFYDVGLHYWDGSNGSEKDLIIARLCWERAKQVDQTHASTLQRLEAIKAYAVTDGAVFAAAYQNNTAKLNQIMAINPSAIEARFQSTANYPELAAMWICLVSKKAAAAVVGETVVAFLHLVHKITALLGRRVIDAGARRAALSRQLWNAGDYSVMCSLGYCNGYTPLHFAAWGEATHAAIILVSHGADRDAQSDDQEKPFQMLASQLMKARCQAVLDERDRAIAQMASLRQQEMQRRQDDDRLRDLQKLQADVAELTEQLDKVDVTSKDKDALIAALTEALAKKIAEVEQLSKALERHSIFYSVTEVDSDDEEKTAEPGCGPK